MIHLKNSKSGFTLLEVLLAVAIVGVILMPIYYSQSSILSRVARIMHAVQRVFVGYDFFIEATAKQQKDYSKKVLDPITDLQYDKVALTESSHLAKQFNYLYLEKVAYKWEQSGMAERNQLVKISFEPPEKEDEKQANEKDQSVVEEKKS